MNTKIYSLIGVVISMLSVVAFFVWGMIEGNNSHSWIVFFVPAIAWVVIGFLSSMKKEEKKDEKPEDKTDGKAE